LYVITTWTVKIALLVCTELTACRVNSFCFINKKKKEDKRWRFRTRSAHSYFCKARAAIFSRKIKKKRETRGLNLFRRAGELHTHIYAAAQLRSSSFLFFFSFSFFYEPTSTDTVSPINVDLCAIKSLITAKQLGPIVSFTSSIRGCFCFFFFFLI
jgi:hypothetical protein